MSRNGPPVFSVVAGGGTAGHTVPAIAIGRAIVEAGHLRQEVLFVGSTRGAEGRLVPEAGFAFIGLGGRGIVRSFAPAKVLQNLVSAAGLFTALVRSWWILVTTRPKVVVSVGGYAGLCPALAAIALRIPLVIADSNAVPGGANRLVARFARASATAFPDVALARAVVTGNPVRPEILAVDRSPPGRAAARASLGVEAGRVLVGVIGGSLGARRINVAVRGLVELWGDRSDIAIHHAIGRRDWAAYAAAMPELSDVGLAYTAVEYEDRMELVLSAADVLVSRAGGSTCAELGVTGVPAVVVPLPGAPGDHQTANARHLVAAGAAVAIVDADCTTDALAAALGPLVADAGRREGMAVAALSIGHRDAAQRVAALVERYARR